MGGRILGMIKSSIVMDKAVEIIEGVKGMKMQVEYRSIGVWRMLRREKG